MANFVHRMTQPLSRIVSYYGATNFLIQSRPAIELSLKRQLSCLNVKSLVPSKMSYCRCHLMTTSLRSFKVVQGHSSRFLESSTCRVRLFSSSSSVDHGFSKTLSSDKAAKGAQMGDSEADSLVNSWTPDFFELYKKLTSDLIEHGNGDWINHKTALYNGEKRLFTKAVISEFPGKFFEYQFFFNKKEQRLKGVIQFGPYTQGPPGCVHGGASASMMDAAIGICVNKCYPNCVTATLSMNYKSFLPLESTALVESKVDKVEGRKIFGSAELKSPDGNRTYVTATALFIQLDPQENKDVADKMKQIFGKPT